jgi:hypothetical protein
MTITANTYSNPTAAVQTATVMACGTVANIAGRFPSVSALAARCLR